MSKKQAAALEAVREARDKAGADPRPVWDFYYLQLVRGEGPETFEAARSLAKAQPADVSAEYAYLCSLPQRATATANRNARGDDEVDKTPALSPEDLDLALACYRDYRKRKPDHNPVSPMSYLDPPRSSEPSGATRPTGSTARRSPPLRISTPWTPR